MHPLGRPNYPTEDANLARAEADRLLRRLRDYCLSPAHPKDEGRELGHLVDEIDQALSELVSLAGNQRAKWDEATDPEVLAVLESVPDVVVGVHVSTHVQESLGAEVDLTKLRSAISEAAKEPPASPYPMKRTRPRAQRR